MRCRVCDDEELRFWSFVAWCDECLTRALDLLTERPGLTLDEVYDAVAAERRHD